MIKPGPECRALTPREELILRLAAAGMGSDEAAAQLGLTTRDAELSLRSAITKLGARSRIEAVIIAIRRDLIDCPDGW